MTSAVLGGKGRVAGVLGRAGPLLRVLAGQGLASATSFATVLALGRWSGETTLGHFALGWSCWFLAMSIGDTLVATPYTWLRAQPASPTRSGGDVAAAAAWGTLAIAAAFALGTSGLALSGVAGFAALWPALPVALAAATLREFVRRHLLACGRSAEVLRVDAIGALLQMAGVAALAATQRLDAPAAFWVVSGAALVAVLPSWPAASLPRLWAARRDAAPALRTMFGYGRWLLLGGVFHVVSVQAWPWLAFAAGGAQAAGLLAACVALVNLLSPVLTASTNHFRPRFMQAQAASSLDAFRAYVLRRVPLFVLPSLLWCAVLAVAGEALLVRVYGPSYAAAASGLAWLGVAGVAVAFAAPLQLALLALRAPASNAAYHGSALIVLAAGLLLWHPVPALTELLQWNAAMNLLACAVLGGWLMLRLRRSRTRPGTPD